MARDTAFHDFVLYDLFGTVPEISSRSMMSGWCIYVKGIPCGAIIENTVYLKAKGEFAKELQAQGSEQFSYIKSDGKCIKMSYWSLLPDAVDNPSDAADLLLQAASLLIKD